MTSDVFHWLGGMPWFGWIALVGMIGGFITCLVKMRHKHAERMEMIRQGMNPDGGKPAGPPEV